MSILMTADDQIRDFREHPSRLEDLLNKSMPYTRRVGEGAVIVMLLASVPDVAWAQVGFHPHPSAAIVLYLMAVLALVGLLICGVGYFFYRKLWVFVLGGTMMAPAIAFSVSLIPQLIQEIVPQKKSWDFSADRSVSRLREKKKPVAGEYYVYYKIRSTVKLPGNRQWSGTAQLVVLTISGNEISSISWEGRSSGLEEVYLEAKRILGELGFRVYVLERGYERVRGGEEDRLFSIRDQASSPEIEVEVRAEDEKGPKTSWNVRVNVEWKQAER